MKRDGRAVTMFRFEFELLIWFVMVRLLSSFVTHGKILKIRVY